MFHMAADRGKEVLGAAAADSEQDRQRTEKPTQHARYQETMRRLDQAVAVAARHMKVEPDPHDYDDAVVERPCPSTPGRK